MQRLFYMMLFISAGFMPFCIAEQCCDEQDTEDCCDRKAHVQLFFSGRPEIDVKDPREDYEWPGINDDAFYDYFTK